MAREAFAPAKINLTLHVTGQRADGYHLLDSLVVFGDVGDRLWLDPGPALAIDVTGPFASGVPTDRSNLVCRAAELAQWTGTITLEKNLPHGAGLGGGSADAAAFLRNLFGDKVSEGIGLDAALSLGADVPVCMAAGPQHMQGVGEQLARVWPVPQLHLVLANPGVPSPTVATFQRLARKQNPPMEDVSGWRTLDPFVAWLARQRNDLMGPAIENVAMIGQVLTSLKGARLARMSGSGSTCFGIYESRADAEEAAHQITAQHPDWWVVPCTTAGIVN